MYMHQTSLLPPYAVVRPLLPLTLHVLPLHSYNELMFTIETCQAASMIHKFYSPNIVASGSSRVGEDALSVSLRTTSCIYTPWNYSNQYTRMINWTLFACGVYVCYDLYPSLTPSQLTLTPPPQTHNSTTWTVRLVSISSTDGPTMLWSS